MMGVVNGETDEPEWMRDFRLKKERRAEDEKRRKEREDQKKQAIPSWKREIMVKRQKAAPTPAPSQVESEEGITHVVGALLEVKASLRKPSFGGGVRSPSREEYSSISPSRQRNPSFSESSRCSSRQRHPSWASDGAETLASDPPTMCANGDPVLLAPDAPAEPNLREEHADSESAGEFRPGIVASLLSKFSSMGENPVRTRLLRAGSSGNISLHQPQPLVNNRLRSLDNLLSGDDDAPFHQPRAPLAKRLSSPIELEKSQVSGRTKYSRAQSMTENTTKAENQNGAANNGRNQNFQVSHQKPTFVMTAPNHPRLPSHGAPLKADHAIDAVGNASTVDLERVERNKENVKSCGLRRPSLSNLIPEEMPAPKTVSTYRSMFETGVTSGDGLETRFSSPPPGGHLPNSNAGTVYKIRRTSSGSDIPPRGSSPKPKTPSPTPHSLSSSTAKSPSPTPKHIKSPSPTPCTAQSRSPTPKIASPSPSIRSSHHSLLSAYSSSPALVSTSSPTAASSPSTSSPSTYSPSTSSPSFSTSEEISPVRESRVEGVTTEESVTESPENSPRKDKEPASPTVEVKGLAKTGAQVFGVKLRKANRHSPPEVTTDVDRPKRSSLRSPSPLDDFFSGASSSIIQSPEQEEKKTKPGPSQPQVNAPAVSQRTVRINSGATPPRISTSSLSEFRQLASGTSSYMRRFTDSSGDSSDSGRINSVSSTGFDSHSISSPSVIKSPSKLPSTTRPRIESSLEKETSLDDVFPRNEDEDIVRDYEEVHGTHPSMHIDSSPAMTITCDIAEMQTTIEDEIPMMMGQSLSHKTAYLAREEEEGSATVILLSVKSVGIGKQPTPDAGNEFDEQERRIRFSEETSNERNGEIPETAIDSLVVDLSDESDEEESLKDDKDDDNSEIPSSSPVVVPRAEARFTSTASVPKQRPTISPRRNPPPSVRLSSQPDSKPELENGVHGSPDYSTTGNGDSIDDDDAFIPCTHVDEDDNHYRSNTLNDQSKMTNGDEKNEFNNKLRSLRPTATRDSTNGNCNNHHPTAPKKDYLPSITSTSAPPGEQLWQKPLMRHKIDQGGKLGEDFNIGDLRRAVGTGSSTFFRSKRRPSETENSNTNGVNGNPEPHSINGEDKTSDSNQSAEDSQKCDVRFIGEGVLIGKSALKSTTGKKLKISFDDNATFYEYPSEQVAAREWQLEHGQETSVSSATLNFLNEDEIRGETDDDDKSDDEIDLNLLKNSSSVSGLPAAGLGTYMPKNSSDYSSMENLLTGDGFAVGFTDDSDRVVRRPTSPPIRQRGSFDVEEIDDDDLSILPMDGGSGWSSSTVAADILF